MGKVVKPNAVQPALVDLSPEEVRALVPPKEGYEAFAESMTTLYRENLETMHIPGFDPAEAASLLSELSSAAALAALENCARSAARAGAKDAALARVQCVARRVATLRSRALCGAREPDDPARHRPLRGLHETPAEEEGREHARHQQRRAADQRRSRMKHACEGPGRQLRELLFSG